MENGEWAGTSLHIPADNYDIHVATNRPLNVWKAV